MNKNIKVAKELIKIAKKLTASTNESPYYFEMKCYEKRAEQYQYKKGCNGNANNFSMNITVSDKNLKQCVKKAFESIGLNYNYEDLFIDDTIDGRILISTMENDDGEQPTKEELQAWKRGEIVLWLCDYEWEVIIRADRKPNAKFLENELKKN